MAAKSLRYKLYLKWGYHLTPSSREIIFDIRVGCSDIRDYCLELTQPQNSTRSR